MTEREKAFFLAGVSSGAMMDPKPSPEAVIRLTIAMTEHIGVRKTVLVSTAKEARLTVGQLMQDLLKKAVAEPAKLRVVKGGKESE